MSRIDFAKGILPIVPQTPPRHRKTSSANSTVVNTVKRASAGHSRGPSDSPITKVDCWRRVGTKAAVRRKPAADMKPVMSRHILAPPHTKTYTKARVEPVRRRAIISTPATAKKPVQSARFSESVEVTPKPHARPKPDSVPLRVRPVHS
jgi:hypothetical protein